MNEYLPDRAAMLAKAALLAESPGLTVLDRDCPAGGHRLRIIAIAGSGTLVMVKVTTAEPEAVGAADVDITPERILELLHAGTAWLCEHAGDFTNSRVESIVLSPDKPEKADEVCARHSGQDAESTQSAGQRRRRAVWQIYDPVGGVSTVHESEAEFVSELTESLRTSPINTELRVSRLDN